MKHNSFFIAILFAYTANVWAFRTPDLPGLPPIDKRVQTGKPGEQVSVQQKQAVLVLRSALPQSKVQFDEILGTPKMISGGSEFLSGVNGTGKAIPAQTAALFAADTNAAVKAFLTAHRNLFGFGPEALDAARVQQAYITPHNGMQTVVWHQQLSGLPIYGGVFIAHTTKKGELVSISSEFVPAPGDSTKNVKAGSGVLPPVSAAKALAAAAQNVGEPTTEPQVFATTSVALATDPEKRQKLQAPGLLGQSDASLVWFPMSKSELRLCWEIVLTSASRGEMFRLLVDAQSGEVLYRQCLTAYLTDITLRVYTNDSPSPFSPGWATPNSGQPPVVARNLLTFSALNTNASPLGWISDTGTVTNETLGNNVDAHTDTNADNQPDLPRPHGSPPRTFDFTLDLSQAPGTYSQATVVQLFYWNNFMHDKLYDLGFTEAAGNFQTDTLGRGGIGNDAVQADAQDGSGFNNANFSTPADGTAGRMQMYIFNQTVPNRDGDLDAQIVLHEYTHGLSWRLVGGGQALGDAAQGDGMGEGWSDFYALCLLSDASEDVNGTFAAGAYATYQLNGATDNQNYYFGIRRYPYCTSLAKNPLTYNDIDPAQADHCNSGAPYHSLMFGTCSGNNADEVHNIGEVWCVTLWDARANLINRYGWAEGNQLVLQLVTDGMKLAPPIPNMLQARDAILQADLVDTGGANQHELWAAFAKRGMGFSATSPPHSASGVSESFDLPDDLRVSPLTGFVSSGPVGGPFNITSLGYSLTNAGTNAFTWVLSNGAPWLTASLTNGTLQPSGPSVNVNVSLSPAANSLAMGIYSTTVLFSNLTSGAYQTRLITLRVGQPDYYTELFNVNDNDLAYSTLTFRPDGSSSYYAACHESASSLPTDPTGGNVVSLLDDSFATVNLSGGATVGLYGNNRGSFYIGSNGYLTLDSGDTTYSETLTDHFSKKRISALFHDLLPSVGGATVSWIQLSDRVAVTYDSVQDFAQTGPNTFQIEWFFDGTIRITYLDLTLQNCLVGLSGGNGVPVGFAETDLDNFGACAPLLDDTSISVTAPGSVIVGSNLTYSIGVSSPGPDSVTGVFVTNTLPASVNFVAASTSQGAWAQAGNVITFDLGTLPAAGSATMSITATATTVGNLANHAILVRDGSDPNPANNIVDTVVQAYVPGNSNLFSAPGVIVIPDSGAGSPYPSTLSVAGLLGKISHLTVGMVNISHTYPDDIAVLLVGPLGNKVILMANAGGSTDLANANIQFDDNAAVALPDSAPITSGTYRPAAYAPPTLPGPAPGTPYATTLGSIYGTDPNGQWKLFVYDDAAGDSGQIANGWTLAITTTNNVAPAPLILSPGVSAGQIQFTFQSVSGHTYYVEYVNDLSQTWQPLQTIPGDGTLKPVADPAVGAQRFYRIRMQ